MLNPSFEQVSGPGSPAQSGYFSTMAQGATGWTMKETVATSSVPSWTATSVYPESTYPRVQVVANGAYLLQNTAHGTRFALIPGWIGNRPQEFVGTLAAATTPGTTYVLSVDVAKMGMAHPPAVQLRLRNSGSGAQSAPLVQEPGSVMVPWTRLTGAVTANTSYDQVVLRYQEVPYDYWLSWYGSGSSWVGLADDVRVCKAAVALHEVQAGWWTTARVVGGTVLGAVLVGGLGWGVRRWLRARGRRSATPG